MIKNKKTRKNSKRRTKSRKGRSRKVMRGGVFQPKKTVAPPLSVEKKQQLRHIAMRKSVAAPVVENRYQKLERQAKLSKGDAISLLQKQGFLH